MEITIKTAIEQLFVIQSSTSGCLWKIFRIFCTEFVFLLSLLGECFEMNTTRQSQVAPQTNHTQSIRKPQAIVCCNLICGWQIVYQHFLDRTSFTQMRWPFRRKSTPKLMLTLKLLRECKRLCRDSVELCSLVGWPF